VNARLVVYAPAEAEPGTENRMRNTVEALAAQVGAAHRIFD
jgi:hypothetical protein